MTTTPPHDPLRAPTPTDAEIRAAVEADFRQLVIDSMTPTRGYLTPIGNVAALFVKYQPSTSLRALEEAETALEEMLDEFRQETTWPTGEVRHGAKEIIASADEAIARIRAAKKGQS